MITKYSIERSYLRNMSNDEDDFYDSLRLKHETIPLPFVIRFDYSSEEPCEIIFPMGDKLRIRYIDRLEQFVYAVTGERMSK